MPQAHDKINFSGMIDPKTARFSGSQFYFGVKAFILAGDRLDLIALPSGRLKIEFLCRVSILVRVE